MSENCLNLFIGLSVFKVFTKIALHLIVLKQAVACDSETISQRCGVFIKRLKLFKACCAWGLKYTIGPNLQVNVGCFLKTQRMVSPFNQFSTCEIIVNNCVISIAFVYIG